MFNSIFFALKYINALAKTFSHVLFFASFRVPFYFKHFCKVKIVSIWYFKKYSMYFAATAAESLESCLTQCDPIDGSPPGSPVPGILQARTLQWVAISFSNAWKWKVKVKLLSRVQLLATSWTAAYQTPPSMGFSRQEYWSGLPRPSPSMFFRWCQIIEILISYQYRTKYICIQLFKNKSTFKIFFPHVKIFLSIYIISKLYLLHCLH